MFNFITENIEKIVFIIISLLIAFVIFVAVYTSLNCTKSHIGESYYHNPTYVHSGSVMIPVGGGYYGDFVCDKWK